MPRENSFADLLTGSERKVTALGSPGGLAILDSPIRWVMARHLSLLNRRLQDLAAKGNGRLLITMPPRHGKSLLTSQYFPAWYLGTYQHKRIILASYEADFAASWGRKARDVLERQGKLFEVDVRSDSSAANRWDLKDRFGGMVTAGVGGPITGRGADLLIIDDPVKNPLSTDTPVPTPDGWKLMGELRIGDKVFDHAGLPAEVVAVSERRTAKRFRVRFSDGSFIDAHPDHPWTVFSRADHSVYTQRHKNYGAGWWNWKSRGTAQVRTVTTGDIASEIRDRRGMTNWVIPNALPLSLPAVSLPVDPYVFGLWLGDGSNEAPTVTAHKDDLPHYQKEIAARGLTSRERLPSREALKGSPDTRIIAVSVREGGDPPSHTADSMAKRLRAAGVWGDKHVPLAYLRAGESQRLDLLSGLMDTDGSLASGQAVFCNTNRRLAEAARELFASLGAKATMHQRENEYGPYWTVSSTPPFCPFLLPRKVREWNETSGRPSIRRLNRTVIGVDVLDETVEYVCVTVDSPSHLFLAGDGMVPTHNSEEAASPTFRNKTWEWYISTAYTRLEPGGSVVLIQTRWHTDDLAGRILAQAGEAGEPWDILNLPALAEEDDLLGRAAGAALWPERFNETKLARIRHTLGEFWFSALYQQRPIPREGAMFQRDWFGFADVPPAGLRKMRAWDLAATEAKKAADPDWTAGVLIGRDKENRYYILDIRRVRATPQAVQTLIRQTAELDGRDVPIVMEQEPGSSGVSMIDHYTRNVLSGWNFRGEKSTGPKAVRAQPLAAQAEAGNVKIVRGTWNKDWLEEVEVFPLGSHDDQVDAASLAFSKLSLGPYKHFTIF